MLIKGLRKAVMTAAALECRRFGAYWERSCVKPVEWRLPSLVLVAVFLALQAGLIYLERSGVLA